MEDEELRDIVQRMVDAGESEENIALVIQNFKPTPKPAPVNNDVAAAESAFGLGGKSTTNPGDYAELFAKGVVDVPLSAMKFVGALEDVGNFPMGLAVPLPNIPGQKSLTTQVSDWYEKQLTPQVTDEVKGSLGGQIASGLGTGVGMMMTGGLGAAPAKSLANPTIAQSVGKVLGSPGAMLGGTLTASPEYEAAKAAGVPEDELFGLLMKNYLVGQTEAIPLQRMFGRLNNITGGNIYKKIAQVGTAAGIGAVEESLQEGVQTYLTNQIAKGEYDPDRDPFWGLANAMTVGGIVGAILPGVGAAMTSTSETERPKIDKKIQDLISLEKAVGLANEAIASSPGLDEGIKQQIDQSAQLTEDQIQAVQEKHEAELKIKQNEDEAKRQEKLAKEAEKNERSDTGVSTKTTGEFSQTTEGDERVSEGPSEEYVAANTAYQKRLAELRESPNLEIGPKGFTPLNDQGTAEAKELTELWQARDNARIADLKTPTPRGKASVKMTPGAALKQQIQTFYRGIAKGVKKGSELKANLLTKVQAAIKEYPLSPKQVSSILTKVKNTNLFTAGSISRLNDYIGKVADDATLADKYDQAYTLRKKIKGKRSSNGLSWQEREALKRFSAVDPDYVDIDQYLGQAQNVNDTLLRPVAERTALDTKSINDYVNTVPDTGAIKEQERQERLAEQLGLSFEEAGLLLGDDGGQQSSTEKREAARLELVEIGEQAKNEVYDKWESGELEGASATQREDIQGLRDIDLNLLSPEQLRDYIRTVDRIVANEDFGGAGKLSALAKAQKDFAELQKIGKDWNILNLNSFEAGYIDSVPMAIQAIVGLPKDAALFQLYMGIKGVSDASVKSVDAEADLVSRINSLRKKHKKAFDNDSIIRQGIYGELIRYSEDTDPVEALKENKEAIELTIENHRKQGESKEADKIAELYKPFRDSSIEDIKRTMQRVDPDGYEVMEKSIEFFKGYADKVAEYNNRYFNEPTTKVLNYSGPRKWRKGGTGLEADVDALNLDQGIPLDYKLGRPKQTSSAKRVTNKQQPDAVLDFNKHMNMINGVKRTIFDIESVAPLLQLVENSKRKELPAMFGAKEGDDKAIKKAEDLKNKLFGKDGVVTDFVAHAANKRIPDEFDRKFAQKVLNPLRKFGYTLSLSGISQIPKQATVLSNVALQLGGDVDLLPIREVLANKEALDEFLKGETISMRGAQKSQFNLGEVVSDKQATQFESAFDKFVSFGFEGWAGIKPLVKTDVAVAKMTYLAFYKQYLRDNDLEYKGLKEENTLRDDPQRQQARAYAKQKTDTLQVVSNPHELGKKIKDQSLGWQIAKALLIPYGTFNANTKARMWADWRAVVSGNGEQRAAAAKDLAATAVEQVTYQSISAALKIYVWSLLVGQSIASAFDLPEDRKREKRTWDSAVKTWKTNLVFDMLPVLMTDPGEKAFVSLVNAAAERALNYDKKNPLFYKYSAPENDPVGQLTEIAGPYGVPIEKSARLGELIADRVTGTKDVKGRERKLTPEQKRYESFVLLLYSLHVAGFMPADFINTIDREYKNQQPGRRK